MAIKFLSDQGHNPVNPNAGAEGNGYREQDLVYVIGKELEALLNANPNFEAITSRNSPDEILGTSNSYQPCGKGERRKFMGCGLFYSAFTQTLPTFRRHRQ